MHKIISHKRSAYGCMHKGWTCTDVYKIKKIKKIKGALIGLTFVSTGQLKRDCFHDHHLRDDVELSCKTLIPAAVSHMTGHMTINHVSISCKTCV